MTPSPGTREATDAGPGGGRFRRGGLSRMYGTVRTLRSGPPGRRFQDYNQEHGHAAGRAARTVQSAAGVTLGLAGLVSYPIPGPPSTLMILCGAALLARSSIRGARVLDRAEMRIRGLASASSRVLWWRRRG
jgi:hypothetical protein